jgi:GNAT superfamily N-acetyltransferase
MSIQIRPAVQSDLSRVTELGIKLIRQHQGFDARRFTDFENLETRYALLLTGRMKREDAVVLVAELYGRVMGHALVSMEEESLLDIASPRAWLHDLYVDEAARGLGEGKLLLQAAVESARSWGSQTLMLHVAAKNQFAQRLFRENGFQIVMHEMKLPLS